MYELIQAAANTFYINCPAKIGMYRTDDSHVILIDTGNDKEAGKKIQKILTANQWEPQAIINTHSNADHIGGNRLLQDRLGCPAYCTGAEAAFTEFPVLEPSFLFGAYPPAPLRNKFLMAQPSSVNRIDMLSLPSGMELLSLPGHFFDMIGIMTPDRVCFLADCLTSEAVLEKYHVSFIYDVKSYLATLDYVSKLEADLFIPSHADAVSDIRPLADLNRAKVIEIIEQLLRICETPISFEEILKQLFDHYALHMDYNQYVLVGSTVRSYLAYLLDEGRLACTFAENRLLWQKNKA
ncbi:MBL fold metallo-hydrolase [Anaerolentibacter hominis]|uniref:MBL fold metallo-hydrolase n=1 Tax=Anaerolentibacter hominis TaxID=3079009 RepID=UPI0031B8A9EB